MKIAAPANPGEKQEELGQFLTASLVADSMASLFRKRCGYWMPAQCARLASRLPVL